MQFDQEYFDALNRSFDAECEKLNETELPDITPSAEFSKNMEKLMHRQKKPVFRWLMNSSRRAACIVCAVLILGTVSVMQVDAVRIPIRRFFVNTFSRTISVDDSSDAPKVIDRYYEITAFPADFEPELQTNTLYMESTFYHYTNRNNPKESLLFGQCLLKDYQDVAYTGEPEHFTDADGTEYLLLHTANGTTAVWNNGEYAFFIISDREKDDLLTVCRSLRIKNFS